MFLKRIIIICLCFLPLKVFSQNVHDDKTTITNLKINISFMNDKEFFVIEKYNTFIKYGLNPKTRYFYRELNQNYKYEYNKKEIISRLNYDIINYDSDLDFDMFRNEDFYTISFGKADRLLSETAEMQFEYSVVFEEIQKGTYTYFISDNKYDVENIEFSIMFPFELDKKEILFSINGKKFNSEIENLKYEIVDKTFIKGTYSKKIIDGDKLLFMVRDKKSSEIENNYIYLIIVAVFIILLIIYTYRKILTKNKK